MSGGGWYDESTAVPDPRRPCATATASRKTAAVARAVASQVNRDARATPAADSTARRSASPTNSDSAFAMAWVSAGSTSTAASPATSGSEDTFDVMTGTPAANASSTGNPNPSYSEG